MRKYQKIIAKKIKYQQEYMRRKHINNVNTVNIVNTTDTLENNNIPISNTSTFTKEQFFAGGVRISN